MLTFKGSEFPKGVIVREVENTVLPPVTTKTIEIPSRHGGLDFGRVYGMREITVTIGVRGKDEMELRSIVRQLAKQLDSKDLEPLVLPDEPDKEYYARVSGDTALSPLYKYEEASIVFLCPNPFPNSITSKKVTISSSSNVNVLGTATTYPTFTINVNASATSLTITNVIANVITSLTLVDNFVNGDVIKVNCDTGEITVNGSSRNILTLDTDFIELENGTNVLSFTGAGTCSMTYKDMWL
jgi:predicted phage tail component-like protein